MQYYTPNSGLQAAMNAASLLEQSANPVAPGPGGTPIKSISGGLMDALQAKTAAEQPAPQSDMGQGIESVLSRFKNALPTMAQNAQEAQTNAIAAKAADMVQSQGGGGGEGFAHGGIARLPVHHEFSDGGILGFSGEGEEGSVVPSTMPYSEQMKKTLGALASIPAWLVKKLVSAPESPQERDARVAQETAAQQTREAAAYTDPNRARLDVAPSDIPPAPPPRPAVAPRPAAAAGAPDAGLPTIAGMVGEARKAMPDRPELETARRAQADYAEAVKNAPLPGIEALKALEEGAQKRQELYSRLDKELPTRQLRAMLLGISKGRLAGGAEAVSQFQNERAQIEANRIAETQLEAMKRQAIKDGQTAFKLNNAKGIAESADKLANLAIHQDTIVGNLASQAFASLIGLKGHEMQAKATRDAANNRAAQAMEMALLKSQLGAKMSPGDILKLDESVQTKFFSPTAIQSPEFQRFVAQQPNGAQLLKDIQAGRVKFDPKKGWGPDATDVISRAAESYKKEFRRSIGSTAMTSNAPMSFEDAFRMFGG